MSGKRSLVLLSFLMLAVFSLSIPLHARAAGFRVLSSEGSVIIKRGDKEFFPVQDMGLKKSDMVVTAEGASIDISLDGTAVNVLRVEESSEVVLNDVRIRRKTEVLLRKGEVLTKVKKLRKGSNFTVRTPMAVAGIRGSGMGVKLFDGGKIDVKCYDDEIYLVLLDVNGNEVERVTIEEGWHIVVEEFEKMQEAGKLSPDEGRKWQEWIDLLKRVQDVSNETARTELLDKINDMGEKADEVTEQNDFLDTLDLDRIDSRLGGGNDRASGGDEDGGSGNDNGCRVTQ